MLESLRIVSATADTIFQEKHM